MKYACDLPAGVQDPEVEPRFDRGGAAAQEFPSADPAERNLVLPQILKPAAAGRHERRVSSDPQRKIAAAAPHKSKASRQMAGLYEVINQLLINVFHDLNLSL